MPLNERYWCIVGDKKQYKYFDKYAYEGIRRDCLEELQKRKFKYPNRCFQIYPNKEWRQYLGAGHYCTPELKD